MPKNSRSSSSLEPVKHLSGRLQQKLVKRASRQRKRFRSSGKPYPLALDMPGTEETPSGYARVSSLTTGQRVALAIASLVILLTLGLAGIAAATHAISGVVFLILVVVALFISVAVIIYIMLSRKP